MKQRHRRKLAQASISHNNAWNWSFDKFVRAVVAACTPMSKALKKAYEKARDEQQNECARA